MSLSKVAPKCQLCGIGKGIYSCPRCSKKYCSSFCYKSREHETCSEAFFQEWVKNTLEEESFDSSGKENMLRILKKFEEETGEASGIDQSSFEDRFDSLNLNNVDDSHIWEKLTKEERVKFKSFIENKSNIEAIVPLKQPWWSIRQLNLVSEINSDLSDLNNDIAARPPFPLNCKKLSDLTSTKPASCIAFNLVNIIYIYAFLCRFYNCELRDFLEEVVDSLFALSPVLSEGRNYLSLVESVQDSIRLISNLQSELPMSFVKSIVDDVRNIMLGPNNARPCTFVLCALHDIKLLLLDLKASNGRKDEENKNLQKKLLLTAKKIDYFISWTSEYETMLPEISSDLVLLMLPDLIPENKEDKVVTVDDRKPLIEEIN